MIGTIRKHSQWLWIPIIIAVVISFVFYFSPSQRMGNGDGGSHNFGSLYGQKITQDAYLDARNEFFLFYFFRNNAWPDKNGISDSDLQRETYIRLLLIKKAENLDIYVSDEAAAATASDMLRSLGRNDQTVSMDTLVEQVLKPEGLTVTDFENFVRHTLAIEQLAKTMGLPGTLITPSEAAAAYAQENQELAAQIVFFSASNYVSQVAVTPAAVAQFYTNYLAAYRLPDRVQVSYVEFNVTNYLAQAQAAWAKTNFSQQVDAIYAQYGAQGFPEEKTPEAAKAKIREILIRQRALAAARVQANEFATAVFNLDPDKPQPENLATVARQKSLAVKITAPFDNQYGPEEFTAPADFTKAAFALNADAPFAGPIAGPDAIYVIALAQQLPSEIPPFNQIRSRVIQDYQMQQAIALAQRAGTNFARTLTMSLAVGKSFAAVCTAAGLPPEVLPPFSLSTRELPELGDRVELNQLKQIAFTTPVRQASGFEATGDGGFILFIQSQLPVDEGQMNTSLPQFTANLRHERENETFNQWLDIEANHELRNTPLAQQAAAK